MEQIRIGIAGLGGRGLGWIRLLQRIPGYRIAAIYDWIEPLQERMLALIPYRDEVRVFSDCEELLPCCKAFRIPSAIISVLVLQPSRPRTMPPVHPSTRMFPVSRSYRNGS